MPEVCFVSRGPTFAIHSHSYLPAQPSEITPESLPLVSLVRYWLGLNLHLLQNPGNTFSVIFMILWSSFLDLMMEKSSSSLPHGEKKMPGSLTVLCRLGSLKIDSEIEIYTEDAYWGVQAWVTPVKKWRSRIGPKEKLNFHLVHQPSAHLPGSSKARWARLRLRQRACINQPWMQAAFKEEA